MTIEDDGSNPARGWQRADPKATTAPGRSDFDLHVGPLRLRILQLPSTWAHFVHPLYGGFATAVDGDHPGTLEIRVRESTGLVVPLPPPGEATVIELERVSPTRYVIRSHWQDGWIDLAERTGELVLTDRRAIQFQISFENYLRVVSQLLLIEHQMFMMHTNAVIEAERAFLFFGPSGAGKTTAMEFSRPRRALSDDMVLVDVASASPRASAVPFYGKFPLSERAPGRFPLAGLFRLRQALEDRAEPLSMARSVATVSASIPFVHELGLDHHGLTDLVVRLCRKVPAYDLHFTRSARFWEVVAQVPLAAEHE